ncbi:mechanosensitive ion channel family protein [Solimonas marina]|uniref:Mechanosensitive ion channel n=1 Tax=Solimonas marina TaxID=2714601 RepID=A0A970B6J1_9GAMM|nr:mechanosensitive ion channel domain-containing protein [Solimonas marina]NKF22655.1 mechanosensitive ion channel [Solimonas marina]
MSGLSVRSGVALAAQAPLLSTLVIVALALATSISLHWLVRSLQADRYRWQQRMRVWLGVERGQRIGELSWLLAAIDLLLLPITVYLLLHVWGLHDTGQAFLRALFTSGFTVGGIRIVVGKLLFGVVLFGILFTATRWLKRKLELDWLVRANVEPATREAAATLFGYVTFIVVALICLTFAGVDLSKLAIVAGALSVGIGFGLQNIVSNFVSGIILLFERPIRSGDYINVGGSEGTVRRMRIRATEIETPDRETLIVPNSILLSGQVRNRDLRSRYGRVVLPVSVAYGSDLRRVQKILLDLATQHPGVVSAGQIAGVSGPGVSFTSFGASSLDFELSAQILEASQKGSIASDLRFAIDAAFREAGIEMPYAQTDVHVRSMPEPPIAAPSRED